MQQKHTYKHRTESPHCCHGPVSSEPVGLDHFPSPRWRPPGSKLPKVGFWCCSDTPRWWHCHKSTPGSFGNPMIAGGGWEEWWSKIGKHKVNKRFIIYIIRSLQDTNPVLRFRTHIHEKTLGLKQIQDHWRVRWSNTCRCKSTDKTMGELKP